jgi:hypothetical protein
LSFIFPAKWFQLFQPMGGVSDTCGVAGGAFGAAGACAAALRDARARRARESEAKMRMACPCENDFRKNSMPMERPSAITGVLY